MSDGLDEGTLKRSDVFVSVVAITGPKSSGVDSYISDVQNFLNLRFSNFEVIVVDNGLPAAQFFTLREQLTSISSVRILRLSRSFIMDAAVFSGLESAIGDRIIVVNPDTDPISAIEDILDILEGAEFDIVQGLSIAPLGQGIFSKLGRSLFYAYNSRFLDVEIPSRATILTGLTRRAVNSVTASSRSHRYFRHLLGYVGYPSTDFRYRPLVGKENVHKIASGFWHGVEMITSYSTLPLRGMTVLALSAAVVSLLYILYVFAVQLFDSRVVEGWTTTSLQMSFMFFVISLVLAVQSEYISRILRETRREPDYIVMEEIESNVMIPNEDRRNVVKH